MREKLYGYYQTEAIFIFEDEDGNIFRKIEAGKKVEIAQQEYLCKEASSGVGLYLIKEGSKNKEFLQEGEYLVAKTKQTAKNGLLQRYRPIKKEDALVVVLRKIGFIPQCLSVFPALQEIEIPSSVVLGCPNYTGEKNWYNYECYTDSTDYADVSVGNVICPTCPKYRECGNHQKRTYRQYYNGTYSIVIKTNARTGEKRIQSIQLTSLADRNSVADLLNSMLK